MIGFLVVVIFAPIWTAIRGPIDPTSIIISFLMASVLLSPVLCCSAIGQYHRTTIPKGSRRDDVSIDLARLKAVSSVVLCPKCDANIDIAKVGDDMVYTCDYCGASGTIEVLKTS